MRTFVIGQKWRGTSTKHNQTVQIVKLSKCQVHYTVKAGEGRKDNQRVVSLTIEAFRRAYRPL